MADVDRRIASHYEVDDLEGRILRMLQASGVDTDDLKAEHLEPIDEFHMGGAAATRELVDQLVLDAGQKVLDIGSGIGGVARLVAGRTGVHVTGVDLTPGYVETATALSQTTGLAGLTRFVVGSAVDLPFEDASFDTAIMLHVGMNVPDKGRLMAEAARVLKPGGVFAIFDVMRLGEGALAFPMPWASEEQTSFVAAPAEYRAAAAAAGFAVRAERARGEMAVAFFDKVVAGMEAAQAAGRPVPPGISVNMGEAAPAKLANVRAALAAGLIAPVEMILSLSERGSHG